MSVVNHILETPELPTMSLFDQLLPVEIVSRIFLTPFDEDGDDVEVNASPQHHPITISHVSRRWRDIALSTPMLWTEIDLVHDVDGFPLSRLFVERSAECSLTIYMQFDSPAGMEVEDAKVGGAFEVIVPHMRRWRNLFFGTVYLNSFRHLSEHEQSFSAPQLECLHLSCESTSAPPIITIAPHFAPELSELSLSAVQLNFNVSHTPKLSSLDLCGVNFVPLWALGKVMASSQLVEVDIHEIGLITDQVLHDHATSTPVTCPNLLRFSIGIFRTAAVMTKLLTLIRAPRLEELALRGHVTNVAHDEVVRALCEPATSYPSITSLLLDGLTVHDKIGANWAGLFKQHPLIDRLVIGDHTYSIDRIISSLVNPPPSPDAGSGAVTPEALLLPNLRELHLKGAPFSGILSLAEKRRVRGCMFVLVIDAEEFTPPWVMEQCTRALRGEGEVRVMPLSNLYMEARAKAHQKAREQTISMTRASMR